MFSASQLTKSALLLVAFLINHLPAPRFKVFDLSECRRCHRGICRFTEVMEGYVGVSGKLICAALAFASLIVPAGAQKREIFKEAQEGEISTKVMVCQKLDVLWRALELSLQNDMAAAQAMLARGSCRSFQAGQKVVIERTDIQRGVYCVRPMNESDCYWTSVESLNSIFVN